jgi:hypothetical protein
MLSEGRWTHDFPISVQAAQKLGFPDPHQPSVIYMPMRGMGPTKGDTETPKLVPQGDSR